MATEVIKKIISLALEVAVLARSIGIDNIFQPGLVKEMIIADILGHELIYKKRDADAHAKGDPDEKYEYLSCNEGGTGQFAVMRKEPIEKRIKSLERISRNTSIFLTIFYESNQTKVKTIYEIEPSVMLQSAKEQMDRSGEEKVQLSFSEKWAKSNGTVVYQDKTNST